MPGILTKEEQQLLMKAQNICIEHEHCSSMTINFLLGRAAQDNRKFEVEEYHEKVSCSICEEPISQKIICKKCHDDISQTKKSLEKHIATDFKCGGN